MLRRLQEIEERYEVLEQRLADPALLGNPQEYREIAKAARLPRGDRWPSPPERRGSTPDRGSPGLAGGPGDARMAQAELETLRAPRPLIWSSESRSPSSRADPADEKNVFLEIRAGEAGEEAARGQPTWRMHTRYAERHGWKVEMVSSNPTGIGGSRIVILLLKEPGCLLSLEVRERAPCAACPLPSRRGESTPLPPPWR